MRTDPSTMRLVLKIQDAIAKRIFDLNFMTNALDRLVELQKEYQETIKKNYYLFEEMMAVVNNTEELEIFHEKLALMHRKKK